MEKIKLMQGDCLELMKGVADKSVDMILCDLPYGTTACKWDNVIPFEPLWEQYNRVIKNCGAIVLTAREPFTSLLIGSNIKKYKHKWVWNKKQSGSFQNAKYMPLQIEEDIVVFSNGRVNYYPQRRKGKMRKRGGAKEKSRVVGSGLQDGYENYSDLYYPTNIIELANPRINKLHPTEKPVALFEYLIKTYTNEGETVLDNCMGSGTTAIACINTNRNYIGFELDEDYYKSATARLEAVKSQVSIFDEPQQTEQWEQDKFI
jgi:site-specific DNA-methyltransferase (adenine-specific)